MWKSIPLTGPTGQRALNTFHFDQENSITLRRSNQTYHRAHQICQSVCTSGSPTAGSHRCANWQEPMAFWDENSGLECNAKGSATMTYSLQDALLYKKEKYECKTVKTE